MIKRCCTTKYKLSAVFWNFCWARNGGDVWHLYSMNADIQCFYEIIFVEFWSVCQYYSPEFRVGDVDAAKCEFVRNVVVCEMKNTWCFVSFVKLESTVWFLWSINLFKFMNNPVNYFTVKLAFAFSFESVPKWIFIFIHIRYMLQIIQFIVDGVLSRWFFYLVHCGYNIINSLVTFFDLRSYCISLVSYGSYKLF